MQRSFTIIGTAALGMLSTAAAAYAIGVQKTAEWEVHILHLAESAGTTTETMSGLSYAAKMMGLEIDQVASAMARFDKQLLSAQLGNAKASQNMSLLGIDPAQIKTSDDALKLLADHFASLPDGALKSGEAMQAFGKSGKDMIPMLNLGSKGIQDFLDQAKAMGLVISKDQAEQAELFEQNITRMKESLHGLWVEITNKTLPILNDLTAKFQDTSKQEGFWHAVGQGVEALNEGQGAMAMYAIAGSALIASQEKNRKTITDLTASVNDHQKAVDALKKSVDAIITSLQTQKDTIGKSLEQIQEYKIRTNAAKLGIDAWGDAEARIYRALNSRVSVLQSIFDVNLKTQQLADKRDLANEVALNKALDDQFADQLDHMMQMSVVPLPWAMSASQGPNDAFTKSITAQTDALDHQIATFGMTAAAIARYDLAQLDSSAAAQTMIAGMKAQQDQLAGMQAHAKALTDAWKQFGDVALRSLDDLIFSGKSFAQVLSDITKQLGEMFLKWALFGFGDKSTTGGGGLFGLLATSLGPLFGLAGGGDLAPGQSAVVGEEGPEIFTAAGGGTITPMNALSTAVIPSGTSAPGAQVNITYQIDARGSSITEEQFQRSLAASEGRAVQRALNMSREMQLRTA